MTRKTKRFLALCAITAAGLWLIKLGYDGMQITRLTAPEGTPGMPAEYLGYGLVGMAALGFLGVNVFYGGILDLRRDPK